MDIRNFFAPSKPIDAKANSEKRKAASAPSLSTQANCNKMDISNTSKREILPSDDRKAKKISGRRYKTNLKRIESKKQYEWQDNLEYIEDFNSNENGLYGFMSRTGSGKTKVQLKRVLHYKKLKKESVTLYVPNNAKILLEQTKIKFENDLKKRKISYRPIKPPTIEDGILVHKIVFEDGFKCFIQAFRANTKPSYDIILKKHNTMNPLIIDEFDGIQTQFGLIHGGCPSTYSKSTIKNHKTNYDKTRFDFLEKLCNQTSVDIFSATLDELINKDLRPYENKINMKFFVVRHTKDSLENVKIVYKSNDDLKSIIVKAYEMKEKTLVFVPNISEMDNLKSILPEEKYPYIYTWNSKDKPYKQVNRRKIEKNIISIFVNGPTRGLDIAGIKNIVLFRGLKASTKEDKNLLSALANQIMGRIRKDGIIYRDEANVKYQVDNLFDLVEKIYENVFDDKYDYLREFWRKISNKHMFNNNYMDNIVRLFFNNWLMKETHYDCHKGDSMQQRFKSIFYDIPEKRVIMDYIRLNLELRNLDDCFINRYVEFEKEMMEVYEFNYNEMIDFDNEEKNSIFKEKKTTGGGNSKPNISEYEKIKGEKCLKEAIESCGLSGLSLLISPNFSDNNYLHEYMHAKPKSELTYEERTKSKYAIPMVDKHEQGLNQTDKDSELFNYDENGITFNYEILKKIDGKKIILYRSKEDIDRILFEYNRLQNIY